MATTIEITYILSSGDITFFDDEDIYSLDVAKEAAKQKMREDGSIESIEINRKDSRYNGLVYEGKMEREADNLDEFYFDSMYQEPPIRYLIITGSDTDQSLYIEVNWENEAIKEWCDRIKTQGMISEPWICRIQEEIYSDDGEWCDMYDGEPWKGFYLRREP